MSKRSPSKEEQEEFIKGDVRKLESDYIVAQQQWKKFPLRVCTQQQLLAQIRKNGNNFIDIDFPPIEKSIQDPSKGQSFDRMPHWRRPRDFMLPDPSKGIFDPQIFEKDIEPNDIHQGQLGDCWFLCAVACIAEMP